jgi:hypothetical protein
MSSMTIQTRHKLNQLQHTLPEGLLVDSGWLQQRGYSRQLVAQYVGSGWLESPIPRIYRRPKVKKNNSTKWTEVVASLQTLLDLPFIVGGRTALELQGYAHYLKPGGPTEIHLYGNTHPPKWLTSLPLKQNFIFHSVNLFQNKKNANDFTEELWQTVHDPSPVVISAPERAILEVLDEIPQHETFHQADMLMQGLTNLRPDRLNKLLTNCHSIKVKRLFLWFAERYNYTWFTRLNQSKIDLGSGKRMLIPGGQLNQKYLITVPKDMGTANG